MKNTIIIDLDNSCLCECIINTEDDENSIQFELNKLGYSSPVIHITKADGSTVTTQDYTLEGSMGRTLKYLLPQNYWNVDGTVKLWVTDGSFTSQSIVLICKVISSGQRVTVKKVDAGYSIRPFEVVDPLQIQIEDLKSQISTLKSDFTNKINNLNNTVSNLNSTVSNLNSNLSSLSSKVTTNTNNISSISAMFGNVVKMKSGSQVVSRSTAGTSAALFTNAKVDELLGVSGSNATNTAVFASNGDGAACGAHYDACTTLNGTWYVTLASSFTGSFRVNYLIIRFK